MNSKDECSRAYFAVRGLRLCAVSENYSGHKQGCVESAGQTAVRWALSR